MINFFRTLGKSILEKEGYFETDDDAERKRIYLKHQSILPRPKDVEEPQRAIVINFDLENKVFNFLSDAEITPENRDYFFAFPVGAPRDRKKFWATNNMECFYRKFFDDSIKYLGDRRKKSKTKGWFSRNISEEYDKTMQQIMDVFYVKEEGGYLLDEKRICDSQKDSFESTKAKLLENSESSKKKPTAEEVYNAFLNQYYLHATGKKTDAFPPIILAKINNKTILDNENLKNSYLNLVYFDLFERFFVDKSIKNKVCHICTEKKEVIGDIPLPMKFYGTTNPLYFGDLKNNDAHKSFGICRGCLKEVLTGMRYIIQHHRDWLLGISCYLIPEMEMPEKDFEKKYKRIFNLLKSNKNYQEDVDEIERLLKKSKKKNFHFSLLFFDSPPGSQAFDVVKLISGIEYKGLSEKLLHFHTVNKQYGLSLLENRLSLGDLRFHLFPTKYSHDKYDPKLHRKDIINLLESFINRRPINYQNLIKRFVNIYRLKFHRGRIDTLAAFKMVLLFSIFSKVTALKGVGDMGDKIGNAITDVLNEDYKAFFHAHQAIYESNVHRQGLFLLGTVISQIIYAQKKSAEKAGGETERERKLSSTFMRKINLNGIPARRVDRLVGEVKNFAAIYDDAIYEEPGIWGNIMDRLQGIEDSGMKGEEIVFYILTGISYANYIGIKKGMEKKEAKSNDDH